jgi:hypothetical protein
MILSASVPPASGACLSRHRIGLLNWVRSGPGYPACRQHSSSRRRAALPSTRRCAARLLAGYAVFYTPARRQQIRDVSGRGERVLYMFEEMSTDDPTKGLMPGVKQCCANTVKRPADVKDGIDIVARFKISADKALRHAAVAPRFSVADLLVDHLRARTDLKNRPRHRIRDLVEHGFVVKLRDSWSGRRSHLCARLILPRSRPPWRPLSQPGIFRIPAPPCNPCPPR